MKIHSKVTVLSGMCAITGLLCCFLRLWFLTTGLDEKGILTTGNPGNILSWVITGAAVLVILMFNLTLPPSRHRIVQPTVPYIVSSLTFCVGIAASTAVLLQGNAPLTVLTGIVGIVAILLCVYTAYLRAKGRKIHFLLHCPAVIFLMLFPVYQYQHWSATALLSAYCFQLLASVSLMLSAYHKITLESGAGNYKRYLLFSHLAVFFCLAAIPGSRHGLFYCTAGLWMLIDCCTLLPKKVLNSKGRDAVELPVYVKTCIDLLEDAGFAAYAVGGCVRDALLGLVPHDYDLCTRATPEQMQQVFSQYRLVLTGEKHGTVGVVTDGKLVEITTYRREGTYQDSRHPDWVEFVDAVEEDLSRRDFTVNAMAYSPYRGFADPFGGREDLQNGILRAVGDPALRFQEDALRILRGIRFCVRYSLTPEESTEKAMYELAPHMDLLAKERIWEELSKLLPLVSAKDLLRFAPVITQIIPELRPTVGFDQRSPHHAYDIYTHTAYVTESVPADLPLRLAALLHDIGKVPAFYQDENGRGHFPEHARYSAEMADAVLLRLKAPTALRRQVVELIQRHMLTLEPDKKILRRWLGRLGWETLEQLLLLQQADAAGKGVADEMPPFDQIHQLLQQIREENACLSVTDLAINGRDLLALGFEPGPRIGSCLQELLGQVYEEQLANDRDALLAAAESYLNR